MMLPDDCTVRMVDLPVKCGGIVSLSPDGHYNIYLNARYGYVMQRKKYRHELNHILNDDFHNSDDIRTVEARAEGRSEALKSIPHLMRARDLLPKPSPMGKVSEKQTDEILPRSDCSISIRQAAVLSRCISELDACFFSEKYDYVY